MTPAPRDTPQPLDDRHNIALRGSGLGTWDWDICSGALVFDEGTAGMFGFELTEFDSHVRSWQQLVHPDELDAVLTTLRAHVEGRTPHYEAEYRIRHKSGEWLWVLDKGQVVQRDEAGRPVRVAGIHKDITERKRAEAALRQSEEKFGRIFQSHPDAIVLTSMEGHILEANAGFTRLTGYSFEEVRGRTTIEINFWADLTDRERFIRVLRSEGSAAECEARIRHRSGELRTCLISGDVMEIDGASVIVGLMRDITRRREAEETLRRTEAERVRHVALLEASLDTMTEGVIISDLEGGIFYWNCPALEMHGYASIDECRRQVHEFVAIFELTDPQGQTVPYEQWPLVRVLRGEEVQALELRVRRKSDGWDRILSYSGALARDPAGKPLLAVLTLTDVTEQRRLETQFRQSQKMDAVGQLAGGVAHDFNNLLTVILGNAGLLETAPGLTAEERGAVQEISVAADRAANLTRQLLAFSRRQVIQLRTHDLDAIVAETTKMLRRVLGENIALHYESSAALPAVEADRGMIEQVLMNLAINARDAMPEGGRLTIRTRLEIVGAEDERYGEGSTAGNFVCLAVSDTGCGIPVEYLPHIFEPFFSTKDIGKGTGLGLATVYGIVRQHGGWLSVESTEGEGTTFEVFLPALPAAVEQIEAERRLEIPPGGSETILLVEDEDSVRQVARAVLERLGYAVIEAVSGAAALATWPAVRAKVDLLFTDLVMPGGVNGRDLAARLRDDKPALKVIYCSGYTAEITGRDFALEEGVNFLQKPYEFNHLARTVRACLDAG